MFGECDDCEDKIKCALETKGVFSEETPCYVFYKNYDKISEIINGQIENVKLPVGDQRLEFVWSAIEEKVKDLLHVGFNSHFNKPLVKVYLKPESTGEVTILVYVSSGKVSRTWRNTYIPDEEENINV
jgi:hypothetical protein